MYNMWTMTMRNPAECGNKSKARREKQVFHFLFRTKAKKRKSAPSTTSTTVPLGEEMKKGNTKALSEDKRVNKEEQEEEFQDRMPCYYS